MIRLLYNIYYEKNSKKVLKKSLNFIMNCVYSVVMKVFCFGVKIS